MATDYLGNHLEVGDIVVFPASGCFMEGVIEKIRDTRNGRWRENFYEVFVKNGGGYKKWKDEKDVILKSRGELNGN